MSVGSRLSLAGLLAMGTLLLSMALVQHPSVSNEGETNSPPGSTSAALDTVASVGGIGPLTEGTTLAPSSSKDAPALANGHPAPSAGQDLAPPDPQAPGTTARETERLIEDVLAESGEDPGAVYYMSRVREAMREGNPAFAAELHRQMAELHPDSVLTQEAERLLDGGRK